MRYYADGTHRGSVSSHRTLLTDIARQRVAHQPAGAQRHLVRRRAGVQMAWSPQAVRQLVHHLYPHEPLGKEWSPRSRLCQLQQAQIIRVKLEAVALDSAIVKVHPDGTGALKKRPASHRPVPRGWTSKIHLVAANARTALIVTLSPGRAHDAPEGRQLLHRFWKRPCPIPFLMNRAYEGDATRQLAVELGYVPVVPPKQNRRTPWEYDRALHKRRHENERLFRRLKGFRRLFSRFEKLDVMFVALITLAFIVDSFR